MAEMKHKSLAAALAAFQADLPGVGKDSLNPHFKSKYADLADMSKVILPALAAQGLSFVSTPTLTDHGFVLAYALLHENGEKIEGEYPLNGAGNDQQKGSSITYARRYALGAVTGAAADDDDGNAAAAAPQPKPPTDWRTAVSHSATVEDLGFIHQRAVAEGWATQDVMKALTAQKKKLTEAQSATADA